MKRLIIVPDQWQCPLKECPPGFYMYEDNLCFKSEYGFEVFCDSGEYFWGGVNNKEETMEFMVQPVIAKWETFD